MVEEGKGRGVQRGRCEVAGVEKERRGEFGQTGDAHFTMTGWVGSGEGKRGREGGRKG